MKRVLGIGPEAYKKIEDAIALAEKKTSGEIRCLFVKASHDYWWAHFFGASLAWLLVSGAFLIGWLPDFAIREGEALLTWQLAGFLLGFLLLYLPNLKRLVLPRVWRDAQVHKQCLANFIALGLTETAERTGVLIYLSQLERRVQILADRGIHTKLGADYWEAEIQKIVRGIHESKTLDSLCEVILDIGEKLSKNFPIRPEDKNELPNSVLVGDHSKEGSDS